ncbi:MAG: glycosyltransferase, partial [Chloroflexota bacterium]
MHLAVNGYFWNQSNVGSGQYTRQLIYHLNRLVDDLDITLVFPAVDNSDQPEAVPPSVKVKRVPMRPGNLGKVIFEQIHFPRACQEVGADLAHIPYWGSPLRSPVPTVVTVHDLITLIMPEYHQSAAARLYNSLVSASARGANHVLTDSNASRDDIIQHLEIPEPQVTTVYLAPSPEFSPDGNFLLDMAVKQKYDLPDFYALYLGGFHLHKNVHTMLLAYTYVIDALGKDYPLVLAGKKPDPNAPGGIDYDGYIKKLNL